MGHFEANIPVKYLTLEVQDTKMGLDKDIPIISIYMKPRGEVPPSELPCCKNGPKVSGPPGFDDYTKISSSLPSAVTSLG